MFLVLSLARKLWEEEEQQQQQQTMVWNVGWNAPVFFGDDKRELKTNKQTRTAQK